MITPDGEEDHIAPPAYSQTESTSANASLPQSQPGSSPQKTKKLPELSTWLKEKKLGRLIPNLQHFDMETLVTCCELDPKMLSFSSLPPSSFVCVWGPAASPLDHYNVHVQLHPSPSSS